MMLSHKPVKVTTDEKTGFPLVAFPDVPFVVGWLPLTWLQLEYYLSETNDRRFDAGWYSDVIRRAGRTAPGEANGTNFAKIFARGLTLSEALVIGRWWDVDRFVIPTVEQWNGVLEAATSTPFFESIEDACRGRALPLVRAMVHITQGAQTMAEQMLLRGGLRELTFLEPGMQKAGGVGTPNRTVEPLPGKHILPLDEGNRARRPEVGMRLFLKRNEGNDDAVL